LVLRRSLSILRDAAIGLAHGTTTPPCDRSPRILSRAQRTRQRRYVERQKAVRVPRVERLAERVSAASVLDPDTDTLVDLVPVGSDQNRRRRTGGRQQQVGHIAYDRQLLRARIGRVEPKRSRD